ncbi:MAG: RNase J family beta-CASP ribonuclease [Clostridia bacterium]|nr:RNase J family beta-CASP ribonuclease [Clostridia bacterium]
MQKETKKNSLSKKKTSKRNDAPKKDKKTNSSKASNKTNSAKKQNNKPEGKKKTTKRNTDLYSKVIPPVSKDPVKISFLGGINEVGKNMTCYEYKKSMFIVDCGLAFPESDQLGVDFVIPDFSYVERNADAIKGVVITHGHEDHIGALCYLLKKINVPVYATLLTAGLIRGKLAEHSLEHEVVINVVKAGDEITLGDFRVEFIKVNHSIPDAVALAIKCESGTIVQTGDFKIDTNPIDGGIIDLSRFAELGKEGVLCLLSDSTNAEQPGYSQSESTVGATFRNLFNEAGDKRIIIATFASNIHRVQQIIDISAKTGRKVALSGRSLENVVSIASELGYMNIPDGTLIGIDEIKNYSDDRLVIVTTGSQGEPMSALSRMASGNHRKVSVGYNDCVIISAKPIPGNEKTVFRVINDLLKLGARVIYEKMYDVHVSGHACQEELKLMLSLVKPKYFIPVHGEQKHLRYHGRLAETVGMDPHNIIIADNGYEVSVSQKFIGISGTVASGKVYVDGYGVGDVGARVMKERLHLGQDGIIIITATIDGASGELLSGPEVVSKGFVYVKEAELLMNEAVALSMNVIDSFPPYSFDINQMNTKLRDSISRLMYERTKRSPMILPILMEV